MSLLVPRIVRDVLVLVSAGLEGRNLERGFGFLLSPSLSPLLEFQACPLELPSCICFFLELLNVTLEGAAAPQASFSPPPFAVVGCKYGDRRQLQGREQGPSAQLTQTDKPCAAPRFRPLALLLQEQPEMDISPNARFKELVCVWGTKTDPVGFTLA